jgi:isopenicillin N synthase-like dioxygenase
MQMDEGHSNIKTSWSLPDPQSTTIRSRTDCVSLRRRDGLIKYASNNTSQNGEDGVIRRLFELLPFSKKRCCVDVGAWDGVHLSNTYSLLVDENNQHTQSEWSGVLIEADQLRFKELKKLHDGLGNISVCAEVSCDPSSSQSLLSILKRDAPDLPHNFDFLSLDVDGMDYWVMANILGLSAPEGSTDSYRPNVICVEFNPTMPTDLVYVQPRSDSIRHGSSLSAFVELATASGYTLVETTLFNVFFVRFELYEQFLKDEVPDTSIEALQSPLSMGTQLYQLYDGTIKLWGCKRMLWHRMPIDETKIQMIPQNQRQFPFSPSNCESKNEEGNNIRDDAIDMSPYCKKCSDDSEDNINSKLHCAAELNRMLQKDGFALVRGTGILGSLCDKALRATKTFLHEADESVRRSCLSKDRARRGYSPMATENFASLVGQDGPNDLVKKFRVGPEPGSSSSSLHQPNAWPSSEVWGAEEASFFISSIEEYFEHTRLAADCILTAICDGINANNADRARSIEVLSNQSKNHTSILTLLGYQYGSRHKKGSKGYMRPLVAAHTDVGVITVLLYDSGKCASLQRVADASKADATTEEWVNINLPDGPYYNDEPVFVVNVGDCLSELTGGSLRSTLHRVMPQPCKKDDSDAARTCLALFVGLEPSASLTLPNSAENLTYEEWRRDRIARATAVLKNSADN